MKLSHEDEIRQQLTRLFGGMMRHLFQEQGASLRIDILAEQPVQDFIDAHAHILDASFDTVPMSDTMRQSLQHSDYVFSGIKTFHELHEAFPSLLDSNGNRKPFEQFLNDVRAIDTTYNRDYLRAEYNFCQASAQMAANWEQIEADGDRYNLQYRTANDERVREEHRALHGVTLPPSDPFWQTYYPPNGWNCRCTAVQVRKSKYPETPHDEAMQRGIQALAKDKRGIFQFNSGQQRKTFPDYNPYTIQRCRDCDIAKGATVPDGSPEGINLAFTPENELCAACRLLHQCAADRKKTQTAIERKHYLHEMEPLLKVKHEKLCPAVSPAGYIRVGFSTYGNKHLFSDTFGRSKVLLKEDLKNLGQLLEDSTYLGHAALTHDRCDNITHFIYYKAELHGRAVRLNVAKEVWIRKNGKPQTRYYLYSVNDINE